MSNKKINLSSKSIYHYTKGYSVEGILRDGFIKIEGNSGRAFCRPSTSFVWFTQKGSYPICALPFIPQLKYTQMDNHFGVVRPSINWKELGEVIGGVFRFEFSGRDDRVEKWTKSSFRSKNISNKKIQQLEMTANRAEDYASNFWIAHKEMALIKCKLQKYIDGIWIDLLKFDEFGFVEELTNYTLDDVISMCQERLCA
jgi:hypothetical protein